MELLNNLNKKLHENNPTVYQNLYQMSLEINQMKNYMIIKMTII